MARPEGVVIQSAPGRLPPFRLGSVEWNPLYVGFLLYVFAIITYRLPIGNAAIVLALLALPFQTQRFRFPAFLSLYGIFIVWAAAGAFMSSYTDVALDAALDAGKLWLIALVAVNALRTRAQLQFFLIFAAVSYVLFPARGAIFNYLGGYTVQGRALWNNIYGNPNDLAALTLLQIGVAVALVTTERQKWVRLGAGAAVAMLSVVILMTQSRGALLALGLFAVLSLSGQKRKLRSLLVLGILAVAIVAVAPSGVWERARGLVYITDSETLDQVDAEGSAAQRFTIWRVASSVIADHPVAGVGLGAYPEAHNVYAVITGLSHIAPGRRDAHSTYLSVLAETGYPGLLIFLSVIGAVLYRAAAVRKRLKGTRATTATQLQYLNLALVAYLFAGLFGSFAQLSHLYIYLALITAVTLEGERELAGGALQTNVPRHRSWRGAPHPPTA